MYSKITSTQKKVSFSQEGGNLAQRVNYPSDICVTQMKKIPPSELVHECPEKMDNRRKYNKNHSVPKEEQMKLLDKQYEQLVDDISKLRFHKKDTTQAVKKLEKLKKNKKKMSKRINAQSYIPSETLKQVESYGCLLLDSLKVLIEYLKTIRESVGEKTLAFLLDLFTTLYNIYRCGDWSGLLVNASAFFSRHFPISYADYAMEWLKVAFGAAFTQSGMDYKEFILGIFNQTTELFDDQLWSNIQIFIVKIVTLYGSLVDAVSFEAIDLNMVISMYKKFRASLPEIQDLVEMSFSAYEFILGNWEHIRSGDWSCLFLGRDETQEFEMEVRLLEQAYTLVLSHRDVELLDNYNMDRDSFMNRLDQAIKKAKTLISRCTSVQQKMSVSNFIKTLTEKQSQIYASLADAPRKLEAYSVKFSGPSSCGKSTLLDICSKVLLNVYGHDSSQRGQIVFTNISEKFESTIMPSHKIICADDVANNANDKPNYDRILNYVNTVPRPLEKADSKEKGIYYPGNDVFFATTNDETLRAMECSSCPESILRRFALDVKVEIKSEFRNKFGGLDTGGKLRYDVYHLTLRRFSHIEQVTENSDESFDSLIEYSPVKKGQRVVWKIIPRDEWIGKDDNGEQDFHYLMRFLAKDSQRHIQAQKEKALAQKELDECKFCTNCHCPKMVCLCKLETQAGNFWQAFSTQELWDVRAALDGSRGAIYNIYYSSAYYAKLFKYRKTILRLGLGCLGSIFMGAIFSPYLAQLLLVLHIYYGLMFYASMKKELDDEIQKRQDRLSCLCTTVHEHLRSNMRKYFAVGASIIMLYETYKVLKPFIRSQDKSTYYEKYRNFFAEKISVPPQKFIVDVQDERDYKEGYSRIPPKTMPTARTTTSADLEAMLKRKIRFVIVRSQGEIYCTVNGIFVAGNVIMVPSHAIPDTFPFDVETSAVPGLPSARTKDQKLTQDCVVIDREHDVAFIHLSSAPRGDSFADLFPLELPTFRTRATTLIWKSADNKIYRSQQPARQLPENVDYYGRLEKPGVLYGTKQTLHKYTLKSGEGLKVNLEFEGFSGLCGGVYIDATKAIIYGFHVAGYAHSSEGYMTCITKGMITDALEKLDKKSPTLITHSENVLKVDLYDQPYTVVDNTPLYMREDGTRDKTIVTYRGQVLKEGKPLESRARTPYVPTPFKGIVENLGERKHRPPVHPNDVAKSMKTLNKLTDPVQHYEMDILTRAIDDYTTQTNKVIDENIAELSSILRIYSQEEAMDGIGEFGLTGIPNSTSAGFPINKTKKDCLVRDPFDESNVKVPREFNDKFAIQQEIDRTMDCWANGLSSEPIYKASSKVNELLPNKKALEKVRKFYGSGFANFVASRRVLAGIPRFMRKFWRETECLVGINPTSKEWGEFYEYLTEYGVERMLAGDFAGFDTRMAAQITSAAAKVMLSWYKKVGCSEDELMLIKGALSDIVHPNILFEGDLYTFANGNPSGNLITVQLNSICNSIMMRYVYYAMMPSIREPFSYNVKLGTYGDDNAMSVRKHCRWFNHTACQEEFAKLDISYTMAHKDQESVPYISIDDVSFLKRNFVKHETLNEIVAPIELDSVNKKFHWIKKCTESPLSPEEQFGAYTDGAFREIYLHGKVAYIDFMDKISNIVELNPSLKMHVSFIPYEEMTQILRPYYQPDYVNDNRKLYAESMDVTLEDLSLIF